MNKKQIQRNREFLKDLRANKKKTEGRMRGDAGGRCCLCVAMDTANRLGGDFEEDDIWNLPPMKMADFYGWDCDDECNPKLDGHSASAHNDGTSLVTEKTHKEIADLFEKQYPEIKG